MPPQPSSRRSGADVAASRLASKTPECVAQKVERFLRQPGDPGFGLVDRQPQPRDQCLHFASSPPRHCRDDSRSRSRPHSSRYGLRDAADVRAVATPEGNAGSKGWPAVARSLRPVAFPVSSVPSFRGPASPPIDALHDRCRQPGFLDLQHPARPRSADPDRIKGRMRNRCEVVAQVRVHHLRSPFCVTCQYTRRTAILASTPAEAVLLWQQVRLEDRPDAPVPPPSGPHGHGSSVCPADAGRRCSSVSTRAEGAGHVCPAATPPATFPSQPLRRQTRSVERLAIHARRSAHLRGNAIRFDAERPARQTLSHSV